MREDGGRRRRRREEDVDCQQKFRTPHSDAGKHVHFC
jgi:hypothetical protein